jgi:sulfatase maturation enzyme AslB (radical SAM superfamily)
MKCNWIENMMSIETDGWTRPCCLETSDLAKIAPIQNGIIAAFNDSKLLQLREDLTQGYSDKTKNTCGRCEDLEIRNQSSMRMQTSALSSNRELKFLQFKMSNKCQLTCAHCGPDRSSGWAKLLNITPHVINSFEVTDEFMQELVSLLPQLEVIKFTGGEPFLDPNHWKILEQLQQYDRSHCELHYITNGISPFKSELWKGWKTINCSVSVDGYEKSYEWFRRGSTWTDIVHGVHYLNKFSTVDINYAITPYTIQDYIKSTEFWQQPVRGFPVVYPNHTSMFNFPSNLIQKLDNWQSIPYANTAKGSSALTYKMWARNWDKKWNTVGYAEKLFWWMQS